ncbi:gamma-glutamylcyclotransferase [Limnobacter humi]|uniref:Putative gamma-glutamylcyclotransferase n=1 Tax=Limnobacter humi TaxID=1778671 RepID=A0ABT1WF93_9BURK|nr:gamma-glutamylcyclotransferase family protein [Limnobacter humi]MCQ8896186.1 gamma-glutamylcyclotransferase [Limnobacter humi]
MHVFVYGSLMYLPVWQQVVKGQYARQPATAVGYARYAVPQEDYPAMVEQAGAQVQGMVWLDVTPEDIERLDAFEGPEYTRQTIAVQLESLKEPLQVDTYLWLNHDQLQRHEWRVDLFEAVGLQQFLNKHVRRWTTTGQRQ